MPLLALPEPTARSLWRASLVVATLLLCGCASVHRDPGLALPAHDEGLGDSLATTHAGSTGAGPVHEPPAARERALKQALEDAGIEFEFDGAVLTQGIDATDSGKHWLSTYLWDSAGSWRVLEDSKVGTGSLKWYLLGASGINYQADDESATANAGAFGALNLTGVTQDPIVRPSGGHPQFC